MLAKPMFRLGLFRQPLSGRPDAFGFPTEDRPHLTGCCVSYNQALPRRLGFHRMALTQMVLLAQRRGLRIDLSGGAGSFKRQRGAQPVRESDALFERHLPRHPRLPRRLLSLEGRVFGRLRQA